MDDVLVASKVRYRVEPIHGTYLGERWTFNARDRMPRSSRLTAYPAPKSTDRHAPSNPARAGSFSGHKDAFPRPRPNDRSLFSQATFAGAYANGRDAPKAGLRKGARRPRVGPVPLTGDKGNLQS